jgi:hypothetical protein
VNGFLLLCLRPFKCRFLFTCADCARRVDSISSTRAKKSPPMIDWLIGKLQRPPKNYLIGRRCCDDALAVLCDITGAEVICCGRKRTRAHDSPRVSAIDVIFLFSLFRKTSECARHSPLIHIRRPDIHAHFSAPFCFAESFVCEHQSLLLATK